MHINDVYYTRRAVREVMGMIRECDQKENLRVALDALDWAVQEFEERLELQALAEEARQGEMA